MNIATSNNLFSTYRLTRIAILAAIAAVLMYIGEFVIPIFPVFMKMDPSDLPVVIGALAMGPLAGVFIELIKNLVHLPVTQTIGVGELANFIMGSMFVIPIGYFGRKTRTLKDFCIGAILGTILMALIAVILNKYVLLPLYVNAMHFPMDAIIGAAKAANPRVNNVTDYLIFVVVLFNVIKAIGLSILGFVFFKALRPFLMKEIAKNI